jgi:hypothetical protein
MLGFMSAKQAKAAGFTHHGSHYGIPVWIGDPEGDFMVATKWAPAELLMTLFHYIEGFIQSVVWPDEEHGFQFALGQAIDAEGNNSKS